MRLDRPPSSTRLLIVLAVLTVVGCGSTPFLRSPSGPPAASATPPAGSAVTPVPSATQTDATATDPPAPDGPSATPLLERGVLAAMFEAIRESSPAGWQFTLTGDRLDGDWRLDGDADDGAGPGRLFVDLTARPGMLLADPCGDPDFRQGARCARQRLPNGDLLVLRDVVDFEGIKTIEVVLVHPDRSGVGAEAGNWPIGGLAPPTGAGQVLPTVTRPEPIYTVEQLAALILAVDAKTRPCLQAGCP